MYAHAKPVFQAIDTRAAVHGAGKDECIVVHCNLQQFLWYFRCQPFLFLA